MSGLPLLFLCFHDISSATFDYLYFVKEWEEDIERTQHGEYEERDHPTTSHHHRVDSDSSALTRQRHDDHEDSLL